MTAGFTICIALSAAFQTIEFGYLRAEYKDPHLQASFIFKMIIVSIAILTAIIMVSCCISQYCY
jgi:hypothetical protein